MANNTVNSSVIGVNLQGNSDGATANFALGSHVLGNANSEWVYVCAGLAITTGMIVSLSATFTAIPANSTGAITAPAPQLAFAQGAFAAADFGWVAIRGDNLVVALSSTSSMAAALYIGQSGSIATVPATATLAPRWARNELLSFNGSFPIASSWGDEYRWRTHRRESLRDVCQRLHAARRK